MNPYNPYDYTIVIQPDEEEPSLFRATVVELPGLADFSDTEEGAFDLIIDSIFTAMEMFIEQNRQFPPPQKIQ